MKLLFIIVLIFIMTGCTDGILEKKSLIVATSADNPPYEFIKNGSIVGLDIDIVNHISNRLDRKVVIKNFDFNVLLAALLSKKVDLVISGMTITSARKNYITFSIPYFSTNVCILYRSLNNSLNLKSLNNKILGVQLGTTWYTIAQILAKQFNIQLMYLTNNLELFESLKLHIIDAIILEEWQAKKFILINPEFSYFILNGYCSDLAIATNRDSNLVNDIDNIIVQLKDEGIIDKLKIKWLEY